MEHLHRVIIFALLGLFLAPPGQAQYVRAAVEKAHIIVIAENTGLAAETQTGEFWQEGFEGTQELLYRTLSLRAISYVMGSGPAELRIPLPATMIDDGIPRQGAGVGRGPIFDGRIGKKSLWILQQPAANGGFYASAVPSGSHEMMWRAPGHDFAPAYSGGSLAQTVLTNTEYTPSYSTMVAIADIFARNAAAAEGGPRRVFLTLLKHVAPKQSQVLGYGTGPPEAELALYMAWLAEQFPQSFPINNVRDRLDALAIRMHWGERELSTEFVDQFLAAPRGSFSAPLPVISGFENVMRLLPTIDAHFAGNLFAYTRHRRDERVRITQIAIQRFEQDRMLDVAMLECLSELWERPDLVPYADGRARIDLAPLISLARRLLD